MIIAHPEVANKAEIEVSQTVVSGAALACSLRCQFAQAITAQSTTKPLFSCRFSRYLALDRDGAF
jgi:hypothetical protein